MTISDLAVSGAPVGTIPKWGQEGDVTGRHHPKPFEHEAKLKELVARQKELNATLDLDKSEKQIAPDANDESLEPQPHNFAERFTPNRAGLQR